MSATKKLKEAETTTEQDSDQLIETGSTPSTNLPVEIVSLILSKLLSSSCCLIDYVRFPAVCHVWNNAFRAQPPETIISLPSGLPLLLFQVKDDKSIRNFYDPTNGRFYDFPLRGKPTHLCSRGSGYGWVVTVDQEDPFSVCLSNLFGPFDVDEFFLDKVAFSVNPSSASNNELVVIGITRDLKLIFCRPGDYKWNDVVLPELGYALTESYWCFQDVIHYKGQFYAITMSDIVVCLDFSPNGFPNPKLTLLDAEPIKGFSSIMADCQWYRRYIVECSGDLFAVRRGLEQILNDEGALVHDDITRGFQVYKLVDKTWVKMKSLNGCSLFLGDNASFSVLASKYPGCKPNHIYFTDDHKRTTDQPECGVLDLGAFNLEDRSFEAVPPGVEIYDNNLRLYPIWVQLML